MISFIEKYKILYMNQYGFRAGYSTSLALIDIIDKIKNAIDNNDYALGIFLDVKKAFDSLTHDILFEKLEHYGFRGHSLNFFRSYLQNREQYTIINGNVSETKTITHGVPQGSILGPLLFLIYINDMQYAVTDTGLILFADDTAIYLINKNPHALIQKGQDIMRRVTAWFEANKLQLSLMKSNFVLFHGKRKNRIEQIREIRVGEGRIPRVSSVRYIGVTIDEKLTWEPHINDICKSLVKYFGIFYQIRDTINSSLGKVIYYTCIYSRIKYGIEVYGSANNNYINKLQILQNKLLKLLNHRHYRYSTNELHKELDLLKVRDIYETSTLMFVFNCLNGNQIENFQNYFTRRGDTHHHDLRNNDTLGANMINLNMGKTTTHYTGTTCWNRLPNPIKTIDTPSSFKRQIKKYYTRQYE